MEQSNDKSGIWKVHADAFETEAEANLVNTLRDSGCRSVSLVAEQEKQIVGHILFTPVILNHQKSESINIMGLAPMAVLSEHQNQGIGSELVKAGLQICKEQGYAAVAVLGHPNFYPKFGFVPSVQFGIKSEYDVPDKAFMLQELIPEALQGSNGVIHFYKAFNEL